MVKPITKDPIFLAQKSVPATILDLPVAQDLKDTLEAHREGCVGMAANMIGVNKRVGYGKPGGGARSRCNTRTSVLRPGSKPTPGLLRRLFSTRLTTVTVC